MKRKEQSPFEQALEIVETEKANVLEAIHQGNVDPAIYNGEVDPEEVAFYRDVFFPLMEQLRIEANELSNGNTSI